MVESVKFPKGFYWGAATSAYQIEGAAREDGKGESIWDRFAHTPGRIQNDETGDAACDHYHRWPGDLALMQDMGLNAYRFSISWSRVLPEGRGAVNERGLDFYARLVDGLLARGIEPFITLYHWDLPQAIQDAGGWVNRRTIDWFMEYAGLIYRTLGDRVKYWMTLNEPNIFSICGYMKGNHAPGVMDEATALQVLHHEFIAHGDAVAIGRDLIPGANFGIAPVVPHFYPATDSRTDLELLERLWAQGPGWTLDPLLLGRYPEKLLADYSAAGLAPVILDGDMARIQQPLDFLGLNFYFSHVHGLDAAGIPYEPERNIQRTDLGWPVYPDGLCDMLLHVTQKYGRRPIIITENGAAYRDKPSPDGDVHDRPRVDYLRGYIGALHRAIANGADVRGYMHWSLMDNFEWAYGYWPRFGLIYVDFDTQQRIVKDSGKFYAEVIKANGLEAVKG